MPPLDKDPGEQTFPTATDEFRQRLTKSVLRMPVDGISVQHQVPGLSIYKITESSTDFCGVYEPSVCFILNGSKLVSTGGDVIQYAENSYLITAIGIPMSGWARSASPTEPYIAMLLRLDLELVRRLIVDYDTDLAVQPMSSPIIGQATERLLELLYELISLDSHSTEFQFMQRHIQTEIFYRLLMTPSGRQLRDFALADTTSHRITTAVNFIKDNYSSTLSIKQLADLSRMGVSTFHHHFKTLTGMSPGQLQKQIRLHQARTKLLSSERDIASVALSVGYESQSQFSREFRRLFGQSPSEVLKRRTTNR
jgi:AraC-like DNA-binding protein